MMQVVLTSGADPTAKTPQGQTPVEIAKEHGHSALVKQARKPAEIPSCPLSSCPHAVGPPPLGVTRLPTLRRSRRRHCAGRLSLHDTTRRFHDVNDVERCWCILASSVL